MPYPYNELNLDCGEKYQGMSDEQRLLRLTVVQLYTGRLAVRALQQYIQKYCIELCI